MLFRRPGTAYVYRSYGIHALVNAVCEPEGIGAAVLIRALEPVAGIAAMRERRGVHALEQLCSGPGKLTQALGIELELNATDLVRGPIRVGPRPPGWEAPEIVAGTRIGITKAAELPWRFCATGSRSVSRPWPRARLRAAALAARRRGRRGAAASPARRRRSPAAAVGAARAAGLPGAGALGRGRRGSCVGAGVVGAGVSGAGAAGAAACGAGVA